MKKWNGKRIDTEPLVHEFRIWLTQQKINLNKDKREKTLRKIEYKYESPKRSNNQPKKVDRTKWIERLLQTPIEDYRKVCLWRIVGSYLLNVRNL